MGKLKGRCLCGEVEFEIEDSLKYAGFCHCSQCRRLSGSAFSSFGGLAESKLDIKLGSEKITYFEKSEGSKIAFCSKCGSQLFSHKIGKGLIHVRLGTLDESPSKEPQAHVFVDSKAGWFNFCDDLPKFNELPVSEKS